MVETNKRVPVLATKWVLVLLGGSGSGHEAGFGSALTMVPVLATKLVLVLSKSNEVPALATKLVLVLKLQRLTLARGVIDGRGDGVRLSAL